MVSGFSKLTKEEKRQWLERNCGLLKQQMEIFEKYDLLDKELQRLHDQFSENTIASYVLPMGVAPNFIINQKHYVVPMVTEESSVVAALSKASKFWAERGGFEAEVVDTEKIGQVHFFFKQDKEKLKSFFNSAKPTLLSDTDSITENMRKRGGGIKQIELRDKTDKIEGYFSIDVTFDTGDAMGANFINTCLEQMAKTLEREAQKNGLEIDVLMSILSNYVPNCLVRVRLSSPVKDMTFNNTEAEKFSKDFVRAIEIAKAEVYRAVTHNKGIMNGIDAVVIATGNDFRAVEACAGAYACRDGKYKSLTDAYIENNTFHFVLEIPLALGTVGGLTKLHPMVGVANAILGNPDSKKLMCIAASVGLAQNFAAVASLVTSGIQKGHMKMHIVNILNQLGATQRQKQLAERYFADKTVSFSEVEKFLKENK